MLIGILMVITGAAAIVVSWKSRLTRYFFLASLVVFLLEFLTPVLFSEFIQETQRPGIEFFIRFFPVGLASILAFLGMIAFFHPNLGGNFSKKRFKSL